MFDERAFQTWPLVILGGLCFGGLFAVLSMMTDLLFDGTFAMSRSAMSFGIVAFIGYLAVSLLIRRSDSKDNTP